MQQYSTNRGFTLIELSIVLVIIGLIVGGVLVGQDLIKAAKLRKVISEKEQIIAAINTFRLKYNGIPGDLNNATSFWGTDPGGCPATPANTTPKVETCNGDGDKRVDRWDENGYEIPRFWQHLANADLLWVSLLSGARPAAGASGYYNALANINAPASGFGNNTAWSIMPEHQTVSQPNGNALFSGYWGHLLIFGTDRTTCCTSSAVALSYVDAFSVDTKIDDGRPGTGILQQMYASSRPNCASTDVASTAIYQGVNNSPTCVLLFNEKF